LQDITEPILAPIRQFIPTFGGWDFSPWVGIFLLFLVIQAAQRFLLS